MRASPACWKQVLGVCFFALSACATPQVDQLLHTGSTSQLPLAFEIAEVPFYPQESHQCGPASLAMAMSFASATAVTPAQLQDSVFTPAREGSLALDLVGASRRQGMLAYPLRPELATILQEISAGRPVVVLQNLALSWYPMWHYAVVIGYDLRSKEIILHSGRYPRLRMSMRTFEHTWARSAYWALLILKPGELPQSPELPTLLQAGVGLERVQQWSAALQVYQSILKRWPATEAAYLGLGNSYYGLKQWTEALSSFRQGLQQLANSAALHNNVAQLLLEQGHIEEALGHAQQATQIAPANAVFAQTLAAVKRAR